VDPPGKRDLSHPAEPDGSFVGKDWRTISRERRDDGGF
jgi:hypothetical protein